MPQIGTAPGTATANPTGGTAPYQFMWSTTPPQSGQTATDLVAGTYFCTATDAHGCTQIGSTSVDFLVGTTDLTLENPMRLTPNPASEWVSVDWENPPGGLLKFQLFDSRGQLVRLFENPANNQLDLTGLPDGLFILQVATEKMGRQSFRFLKTNR